MPQVATNTRILIVDDNPAIHEDYRKILALDTEDEALDELSALVFGDEASSTDVPTFELISAHQGQEAYELVKRSQLENTPFAMAFVDMRMPPGWDGLQTIEHLWQVDPRLQVVICTAFSDYSWSEIIERIPYRDRLLILKKPFDNVEVCQLAIALTQKWDLERHAESKIDSIVETAVDGILTMTTEGVIESSNQAASFLFGFSRDELVGKSFATLLTEPAIATWQACVGKTLTKKSEEAVPAIDVNGVHKSGKEVPMLVSLSQFDASDGKRWTAILRDLTEYKQLQDKLNQARKLESVGQLAAGVAHEINTPMQFIHQNIEFVRHCTEKIERVFEAFERNLDLTGPSKTWDERWGEMISIKDREQFSMVRTELPQAIEETLEGVRRVVEVVQAMSRFTNPGQESCAPLDINKAIESATTVTRNTLKKIAKVHLHLDPKLPELVCVPHEIHQVLLNLIVNASDAIQQKYGEHDEPQGRLTLRTIQEPDHAVIVVEDDGVGIPLDIRERVYDPFFTTKEVGRGTGQGLSVVYNTVVHKHGGSIDFDSTPGVGTRFTIRLPWDTPCETLSKSAEEDLLPAEPYS
ncbi:ATP-binding response regulator [Aeoliella mucimassa]|uniref:histidine kinase n=1 Tax=Aeoliella mucimassa TaxID=2527972 RepID=A0A518AKN1_9BACT|nr:ATP-binding protein [Aeoliella mucimassa]QDU55256.1 Sensor protein FixL [Aeoliella mucimassa]